MSGVFCDGVSMLRHLKFVVRYWSSLFPAGFVAPDTGPAWIDYSVHPASKLGLHNALLAVHDRLEILADEGGYCDSAVFLVGDGGSRQLSPEMAASLFAALPHGTVKWLEIGKHPLLANAAPAGQPGGDSPATPESPQLPLFSHTHTRYDDLDIPAHRFDLDV